MKPGPIFIIGAPRSGTTLLQYMLRSHPRISFPTGESHFMVPLYRESASFGDLRMPENMRRLLVDIYRRSADFIDSELHGLKFEVDVLAEKFCKQNLSNVPAVIRGLMELNAHGEGKLRWGDKTPYYSLHVPLIMEMFPDAQIIHILRDGRDCALSMLERGKDLDIHNIYHATRIWKQYVDAGQAAGRLLDSSQYYEFRYEDLLQRQLDVVSGLCDFLGEEFSESVINYRKASGSGKTPLLRKPIQAGNSEKWKNRMSRRQIRMFECIAGDTLTANGYTVTTAKESLSRSVIVFYEVHQRLSCWKNQRDKRKSVRR